jgi:ABC-type multidrug transport system permease subunit
MGQLAAFSVGFVIVTTLMIYGTLTTRPVVKRFMFWTILLLILGGSLIVKVFFGQAIRNWPTTHWHTIH